MKITKWRVAWGGGFVLLVVFWGGLYVRGVWKAEGVRLRDEGIVAKAYGRQAERHEKVEAARAGLVGDDLKMKDWSLVGAMSKMDVTGYGGMAERYCKAWSYREGGAIDTSSIDMEKLESFLLEGDEFAEFLLGIDLGLCEFPLDEKLGMRQVTNVHIRQFKAVSYMIAARGMLLVEAGDDEGALDAVLAGHRLVDSLVDVPELFLNRYFHSFLSYSHRLWQERLVRLQGGFRNSVADEDCEAILAYGARRASIERMVEKLRLRSVQVRQWADGSLNPIINMSMSGYDEGIDRLVEVLEGPRFDAGNAREAIASGVPAYAGDASSRLQNVSDVLYMRNNLQSRLERLQMYFGDENKR